MKKILYFVTLSIFTLLPLSTEAKTIKFIQVTDVHLTKQNSKYLHDFVNDVNTKYNDVDFVVFTGDNIDRANFFDLKLFLETIKGIHTRKYVLVGNHDVSKYQNIDKHLYMNTVRHVLGSYHSNKTNYVFKYGEIVFVVMDGVKEVIPGPGGYYKSSELLWLDKMLSKYKNNKVVILQHFPLLDARQKSSDLYEKDEYNEVLNKHNNVIAVVSGHYHENREEFHANIYHIVTSKFLNNTYYKVIEVDSDTGLVFTQLIGNNETNEI